MGCAVAARREKHVGAGGGYSGGVRRDAQGVAECAYEEERCRSKVGDGSSLPVQIHTSSSLEQRELMAGSGGGRSAIGSNSDWIWCSVILI